MGDEPASDEGPWHVGEHDAAGRVLVSMSTTEVFLPPNGEQVRIVTRVFLGDRAVVVAGIVPFPTADEPAESTATRTTAPPTEGRGRTSNKGKERS